MQRTLVDSGPLIALFDANDFYHQKVKMFLTDYQGNLISTWPVITEVSHLLDFNKEAELDFLRWIISGGVEIANLSIYSLERITDFIETYSNVPMDLADASIMYVAEELDIQSVVTLDTDYYIYRTKKKKALNNLLTPFL